MFFQLVDFSDQISVFNVFRYITFRTGGALVTSALLVFLFGPRIINSLRVRQGKGQPIRADGPQTHFKKAGTPTMGGLMILFGIIASTMLWANLTSAYVWVVLLVMLAFGIIGFYDDYLKVTKQSHLGFSGKARLSAEFRIAGSARPSCKSRRLRKRKPARTAALVLALVRPLPRRIRSRNLSG